MAVCIRHRDCLRYDAEVWFRIRQVRLSQTTRRHFPEDPNLQLFFIFITVLYLCAVSMYLYKKCLPDNFTIGYSLFCDVT